MVGALAIFLLVIIGLLGVTGLVTYVIEKGQEFHFSTIKPCCPPGLGCNDPDPRRRQCRRSIVYRIAEFDEGQVVDRRWQEFNETSKLRPLKRHNTKQAYAKVRDSVYERELAEAAHKMLERQPGHAQLPSTSAVVNTLSDGTDLKNAEWEILD